MLCVLVIPLLGTTSYQFCISFSLSFHLLFSRRSLFISLIFSFPSLHKFSLAKQTFWLVRGRIKWVAIDSFASYKSTILVYSRPKCTPSYTDEGILSQTR